jgi:hypothetical protein
MHRLARSSLLLLGTALAGAACSSNSSETPAASGNPASDGGCPDGTFAIAGRHADRGLDPDQAGRLDDVHARRPLLVLRP